MGLCLRVAVMTVCCLAGPCSAARAQTAYEVALDRALTAHAAGDDAQAWQAMQEAHALEPSARTLRGLGIIAQAQGRDVDAVVALQQALSSTARPLTPELRAAVDELLARVLSRLARLRLEIEPSDAAVLVDEREPVWSAERELLLRPGHHRVTVFAQARTTALDVELTAGAVESLRVVLAEPASSAAPEAAAPPKAGAATRAAMRAPWSGAVRSSAWSAAGALAVGGAALWLTAWRRFDGVAADCRAELAGGCTEPQARERFDGAHVRPLSRAAAVTSALGGAMLIGALSLELSRTPARDVSSTRGALRLAISPHGLALTGSL